MKRYTRVYTKLRLYCYKLHLWIPDRLSVANTPLALATICNKDSSTWPPANALLSDLVVWKVITAPISHRDKIAYFTSHTIYMVIMGQYRQEMAARTALDARQTFTRTSRVGNTLSRLRQRIQPPRRPMVIISRRWQYYSLLASQWRCSKLPIPATPKSWNRPNMCWLRLKNCWERKEEKQMQLHQENRPLSR